MPRMPKYLKEEWAFFLDERGRKKYNELCRKCERSCKQSFRADLIACPHFSRKAAQCRQLGVEKVCDSKPQSGAN